MAMTNTGISGTALTDVSNGAFARTATDFHNVVSAEPGAQYPAEPGRYHLYVASACPWAHRCMMVRALKGLQDVISVSVVHPTFARTRPEDPDDTHCGWAFRNSGDPPVANPKGFGAVSCEDCIPDTVNGFKFLRDLYDKAGYRGHKYTVPVLWDKVTGTIVCNESSEIIRILTSAFDGCLEGKAPGAGLDLYPAALRPAIDEANAWIYDDVNNGVYKCGFAQSQDAYDAAAAKLFAALDRLEALLGTQRYVVAGAVMTEADVRLFATLLRFDEVYVVYFKCNRKCVREYPNLLNFCREMYQLPGIAETINMRQIKEHYYTSHAHLNPFAIIPTGPDSIADFERPHDRDRFVGP